MQLYLPSLFLLLLAGAVIAIVPKISPLVIAVLSSIALVYVAYSHYNTFKTEYSNISMSAVIRLLAPYIILGAILFFITGYLLYLFKRNKTPSLPDQGSAPSAQSATNPLTYAVSNVMGMVNPAQPKASTNSIRPAANKTAANTNLNALLSAIKGV